MAGRRFPRPWRFEPIPGASYRCQRPGAVYGQPPDPVALSDKRLTSDEARRILRLPKRMPVPEVAQHLVCSKCGARNSDTYNPIWARPMRGSAVSGTIRTTARAEGGHMRSQSDNTENAEFAAQELSEAPVQQRAAML